jgi:hypothetical protein
MNDTKKKCKNEIHSFFGLTIMNIVIAAIILAFGISIGVTQLLSLIETGQIHLLPLLLIGAGFAAVLAGLFWLVKTAEILDGIQQINTAYDNIPQQDNHEQITTVIIEMISHYRKNKSIIRTMSLLGFLGGGIFVITGCIGLIQAAYVLVTSAIQIMILGQLASGIIGIGVGVGCLLITKYFKQYSGVWETRLQEEKTIQQILEKQLESK